jgi:hypothetical protein
VMTFFFIDFNLSSYVVPHIKIWMNSLL